MVTHVAQSPDQQYVRPERLIIIFLLRCRIRLGICLGWFRGQNMHSIFIRCIDISLGRGHCYLDLILVVSLARVDDTEISGNLIIALRSP